MTYGEYPARRAVAERVHARFARLIDGAGRPPHIEAIEALIDAGFWTSLRREEGYVPMVSLALVDSDQTPHPLRFAAPLRLSPAVLARVGPAVERPGIHLGVSPNGRDFVVWGATRVLPQYCLVLEVAAPGLLVVKQHELLPQLTARLQRPGSGADRHRCLRVRVNRADRAINIGHMTALCAVAVWRGCLRYRPERSTGTRTGPGDAELPLAIRTAVVSPGWAFPRRRPSAGRARPGLGAMPRRLERRQ